MVRSVLFFLTDHRPAKHQDSACQPNENKNIEKEKKTHKKSKMFKLFVIYCHRQSLDSVHFGLSWYIKRCHEFYLVNFHGGTTQAWNHCYVSATYNMLSIYMQWHGNATLHCKNDWRVCLHAVFIYFAGEAGLFIWMLTRQL